MTWVLIYTRAGERVAWLRIVDVPDGVRRAEVMDRLEAWRRWPAFAPGPAGRLSLVTVAKAADTVDVDVASVVRWAELAPAAVRTTVELDGEVHAAIVRKARRRGLSQAAWMVSTLTAAAFEVGDGA